jgi:hypothetical protein
VTAPIVDHTSHANRASRGDPDEPINWSKHAVTPRYSGQGQLWERIAAATANAQRS